MFHRFRKRAKGNGAKLKCRLQYAHCGKTQSVIHIVYVQPSGRLTGKRNDVFIQFTAERATFRNLNYTTSHTPMCTHAHTRYSNIQIHCPTEGLFLSILVSVFLCLFVFLFFFFPFLLIVHSFFHSVSFLPSSSFATPLELPRDRPGGRDTPVEKPWSTRIDLIGFFLRSVCLLGLVVFFAQPSSLI